MLKIKLLEGKVAIITGAGRGIGYQEAISFAKEGCNLLLNDLGCSYNGYGQERVVDEVAEEINKTGGRAIANYDDVSNFKQAEKMVEEAISEFGKLDIVINNAGIIRDRMIYNMTEEEWDAVVSVHLKGTFNMSRHIARYFREKGKNNRKFSGRIINAVSDAGLLGNLGQTNYGSAKSGIAGMTLILAGELKKYATVNAVIQIARTRFTLNSSPQIANIMYKKDENEFDIFNPMNVVPIMVFLASDKAKKTNGEIFRVAGDKCWILRGWHSVNRIDNNSKIFDPDVLGKRIKQELLKNLPKKETVMEVFSQLVKM
ncbi:MAG: SDR family NAD(P)-dependent oxidoreductase [Candidatus Lokiarchaeota archaeon]|nr:SDR family NAD(P)-dependent oxidoreductase [Candidatus Lokiarchaeota archaeon]